MTDDNQMCAPAGAVIACLASIGIGTATLFVDEAVYVTGAGDELQNLMKSAEYLFGKKYNWIATIVTGPKVLFEPRYTRLMPLPAGTNIFHVSSRSNRNEILKNGILPRTGGNTRFNRKYPARSFYALDMATVDAFIKFQAKPQTVGFKFDPNSGGRRIEVPASYQASDLDIFEVKVSAAIPFFNDVLFSGQAVWCEETIPPDMVTLKPESEIE